MVTRPVAVFLAAGFLVVVVPVLRLVVVARLRLGGSVAMVVNWRGRECPVAARVEAIVTAAEVERLCGRGQARRRAERGESVYLFLGKKVERKAKGGWLKGYVS